MGLKEDSAAGQAIAAVTEGANTVLPLFVDFTSDLIDNVLETVTNNTLEQLQGYASLVASVSGTLADFQKRTLGGSLEDSALKYANDVVIQVFGADKTVQISGPSDSQTIEFDELKVDELKASFSGVTAKLPASSTEAKTFDEVLADPPAMPAPDLLSFAQAKLNRDTEASYRTLITLLKLGMQKIVMTDCTVRTSTTFHVDSKDTFQLSSSQTDQAYSTSAFNWGINASRTATTSLQGKIAGFVLGRAVSSSISGGASGARSQTNLRLNVVNEKKTSLLNTDIDITGFVELKFRSDYFPSIDPANLPAPV
jgi:hypothetical protein